MSLLESMKMQENPVNPLKEELLLIRHASSGKMYLYDVLEIKKVNPNIRKAVRRNGATFCNLRLGVQKIIISLLSARMLMQTKVSTHCESVCLLSKVKSRGESTR